MLVGGGLENGGGIGRLVGYVVAAWNDQARGPMHVIDTRGPKYRRIVWPIFMARSIWQIVRAAPQRPILHVHLASNTSTWRKLIIVQAGRILGLRYLLHLHDPTYEGFYRALPGWLQAPVRSMFQNASRIVALGAPAAHMVTRVFAIPSDRIDIIANGVPGPEHPANRDPNDRPTAPHILFLGQLLRRKGVHDLIEALSRREIADLPWVATLAGGGPDQAGFAAQAAQGGIRDRIDFPGWLGRGPITALLEKADILVLPSYAEEMAMSVLEGMAYGLCVVCTPVGAQAEVVQHDISALVVTPGDIDGLAAALAKCLADPSLRRRLGQGARGAYLQAYNIADYPQRIAAVYERVNGGHVH
jgi:glycosyltransferase involved in cell wall biosynthesis